MNREWSELNRLSKKREEFYHRCALRAGLSDTKFWILYALCESGGRLCQNSICQTWCYSKQTVNAAAAGLEQAGILRLEFSEGSKKQKDLRLTPAGEAFCRQHIRPVLEEECKALSALSPADCRKFLDTGEALLTALESQLFSV